jgi:tetratricopeptide (TPR) repeat protein
MKIYLLIAGWLLTSAFLFSDTAINLSEDLKKAEDFYNNKKFDEALKIYSSIESDGYTSSDFYYNFGNIHYRLGNIGKAILYYEKAHKLNPNDGNVKHNLNICYSKTVDKIEFNENFFIQTLKEGMVYRLSEKHWGWISILFSFLAALLLAVSIWVQSRFRPILIPLGILVLILSIFFYGMGRMIIRENNKNAFAVVLAKETPVRSEPLEKSFVKFRLHEGSKIRVLEFDNEFVLIKLSNGNEGWVKNKDLGFI